eukprot:gene10201-19067_t
MIRDNDGHSWPLLIHNQLRENDENGYPAEHFFPIAFNQIKNYGMEPAYLPLFNGGNNNPPKIVHGKPEINLVAELRK